MDVSESIVHMYMIENVNKIFKNMRMKYYVNRLVSRSFGMKNRQNLRRNVN